MDNFTRRFITEWRRLRLPFENETFVAAVSGGADSVSLLLALHLLKTRGKLKNRLVVAHFNHNLRGAESERDAEFVKTLCAAFDCEFALKSGAVSAEGNLEQNARAARYEFLRETAENLRAGGILTAHTVNDQAETFLINLIRGSGVAGLSAMRAAADLPVGAAAGNQKSEIRLIRPLLNWATRRDTENYCRRHEIEPRHDAMNEDLKYTRVRIRRILLPMLEEFNPKIIETLANTANLLRGETDSERAEERFSAIDKEARESVERSAAELEIGAAINTKCDFLVLNSLRTLPQSTLYAVLRDWLNFNRNSLRGLTLKHIQAVEKLAFSRKSGRTAQLPRGETVVRQGGKLMFKAFNLEK